MRTPDVRCWLSPGPHAHVLAWVAAQKVVFKYNTPGCCRPSYADLVFVLDGERFELHRAVLAARSPYYHKMLRTAWAPVRVPPPFPFRRLQPLRTRALQADAACL